MGTVPASERVTLSPVVQTTHGAVRGLVTDGVFAFLGARNAAPVFAVQGRRQEAAIWTAPSTLLDSEAARR